jgi:hypothetical protein
VSAPNPSRLINIAAIVVIVILSGFSLFIYAIYPPGDIRDIFIAPVVVFCIGFGVIIAGYLIIVKNIFLRDR